MKSLSIQCTHCAKQYTVRPDFAGRTVRCAACKQAFRVPAQNAAPIGQDEPLTCRWCGFTDNGNYCSRCGGRLQGDPFESLSDCLVSKSILAELKRTSDSAIDGDDWAVEAYYAAEELNRKVMDVSDALRKNDHWQFDHLMERGETELLLDKLDRLPGISDLRVAVWTLVSDLERKAADAKQAEESERQQNRLDYLATQIRSSIEAGSLSRAKKWLTEYRESGTKSPELDQLETAVTALEQEQETGAARKAYAKLEEKAAKLSFTGEHKKAVKAWQECLFWLSRNEHPEKRAMEEAAQKALEAANAAQTG